jgi:hypothetical protein
MENFTLKNKFFHGICEFGTVKSGGAGRERPYGGPSFAPAAADITLPLGAPAFLPPAALSAAAEKIPGDNITYFQKPVNLLLFFSDPLRGASHESRISGSRFSRHPVAAHL